MASSAVSDGTADGTDGTDNGPGQPELKPRYGRIAVFGTAVVVTATAVLGGLGVLPSGGTPSHAATRQEGAVAAASLTAAEQRVKNPPTTGDDSTEDSTDDATEPSTDEPTEEPTEEPDPEDLLVPEDSGEGRRVVFDEGTQRVWLVERDGSVERTYLVSGSIYDNLDPGSYSVFSRDKRAWGIDGSELRYKLRFTTGAEAAIGFHNIPVLDGDKVQTRDELGTPLSHGCVRQWGQDAQALWEFAPLGTSVVVVNTDPTAEEDQSAEG
jgi:hypothetical protein